MENIGNRNEIFLANKSIDTSFNNVLLGISALSEIHNKTNTLVEHDEGKLSDNLLDSDVLRTYVLATIVELCEFVQTLPWKPWRQSIKVVDNEKLLDEFADILAFIGVLITILNKMGFSSYDITKAYIHKEGINVARFTLQDEENNVI